MADRDAPTLDDTQAPSTEAESPLPLAVVASETYTIIGEHARGGIGRVVRGEDRRLRRTVAIKELLRDDDDARRRFLREAGLTARLQHPAIAPIYEAGVWPSGRPFYAMKFISGRSLKELVADATTLDARLALLPHVLAIAEAITYAHSQRVIHRDLKPSNVIVGEFGETMVVDWGLGKYLDAAVDDPAAVSASPDPAHTVEGAVVGTPAFMSPEQAAGKPVDERTDVYAIGAILYNVLAGTPPYLGATTADVLAQVISANAPPVDAVEPGVPRDLVAIVTTAMAREREQRYASAKDLASDLKRFQTGQLVGAHSYSPVVLLGRWIRRNRAAVTTAALLLVVMIVAGVFSLRRILDEHDVAEAQRSRAEARAQELVLVEARLSLDRDPTASIAWLKTARIDDASYAEVAGIAADARARGIAHDVWTAERAGALSTPVFSADGSRVYMISETSAIFSVDLRRPGDITRIPAVEGQMNNFLRTADGSHLVATADTGELVDIDAHGSARVLGEHGLPAQLTPAPSGHDVVTCGDDGVVRIWDLGAGTARLAARVDGGCRAVAWSPDGALLAITGRDARTRVVDAHTSAPRELPIAAGEHRGFAWSPSGRYAVAVMADGELRATELATGKVATLKAPEDRAGGDLLADDRYLTTSRDGSLWLWPLAGGPVVPVHGHTAKIESSRSSVDGARLATCSEDATARVWDLRTLVARVFRGHTHSVYGCDFSPDGNTLATAGNDGTLRVWPLTDTGERTLVGHTDDLYAVEFSPDGARIASADVTGEIRIWEVARQTSAVLAGHSASIEKLAFSANGTRLVSASWDGTVRVWDLASHSSSVLTHPARVEGLAVTPDGATVVTGCRDGRVRVWDAATARMRFELAGHTGGARYVVLSPDGSTIASGGEDGTVRLWDLATGAAKRAIPIAPDKVTSVAFARGGRAVVAGAGDGSVGMWSADTGDRLATLRGHRGFVRVAVSPDGHHAITGGDDHAVWLWDLDTGLGTALAGHRDAVRSVSYSPDGRFAASAGQDATVRLWDAQTGRLVDLARNDAAIMRLAFSPDGRHLATVGWDRRVHVFPIDPARFVPARPERLRAWLDELTTAVLVTGGIVSSN
jgi:WD40 repeat protein